MIIKGLMGLDNDKTIITQARHAQTEDTDRTIHNPTLPILSIINLCWGTISRVPNISGNLPMALGS